ncbi:MAG TPA: L-histidine N(alpha)-methyltransferase [Steroidobacteraceae bacterium]|nr:L-histidine N(alpha)-methyltransferase [Steroidobacteraceae bacterium]
MLATADYRLSQPQLFRQDVIAGLSKQRKSLPSRWLYDERGSELFEQITQLEEYYPTRVETGILRANAAEMAGFIGKGATLIEYGAGAGIKTEILIEALQAPRLYVPVDISGDFLDQAVISLRHRFPNIGIWPIVADFTGDFEIPGGIPLKGRSAFFPGSTIGNLDHGETVSFLRRMHRHVGAKGTAVIGADLTKDVRVLRAAYNDREGVTAAFNANLLARINRELDGDFRLERFAHEARWNSVNSAVEMHLVSTEAQTARVDGQSFDFEAGETIHTETSRKYDVRTLSALVEIAGWYIEEMWTDPRQSFGVFGLASLS